MLVTDFYSGYDSIECPQQKCLIHLIRDINDDLMKNPYDEDLKSIAHTFGALLRMIVERIDRYGLKSRYMSAQRRQAQCFLDTLFLNKFTSEIVINYQKRFTKYSKKLFTFLEYDGEPWNNNNAGTAIKCFARYRRFADGRFTARSLNEYLLLLSIIQTCEYSNVNVMRYLLSKDRDLDAYIRSFK